MNLMQYYNIKSFSTGRTPSMKTGLIAGSFDLVHPGYIRALQEARQYCDDLIVALHVDPSIERVTKNSPVNTVEDRAEVLMSNRYINGLIVYETEKDLHEILEHIVKPQVYFVGADHKNDEFTGKDLQINVIFLMRNHNYSASALRKKIFEVEENKQRITDINKITPYDDNN